LHLQLEDKLALVTGSTAGIGFAIVKGLAAEGAQVIINGRTDARLKKAMATIRGEISGAKVEPLSLDLSKAEAVTETTKRFPDLDILVNNLGVYGPKPFEEISSTDWSSIIERIS
jgi:NAD(P)-dependent dehydrogenase (short-subunit alcohol dehydrogenase family)